MYLFLLFCSPGEEDHVGLLLLLIGGRCRYNRRQSLVLQSHPTLDTNIFMYCIYRISMDVYLCMFMYFKTSNRNRRSFPPAHLPAALTLSKLRRGACGVGS